jgi:hypothetical protein
VANGWTNRGKYLALDGYFRNATEPVTLYIALVTSATAPTADTNTLSQLTEIAVGSGYVTGGKTIARNSTDFNVLTEDDAGDLAFTTFIDQTWNASGGSIPASGSGARWAVLTDDNATVGSRQVIAWFDLSSDRSVANGQFLTLTGGGLQLT